MTFWETVAAVVVGISTHKIIHYVWDSIDLLIKMITNAWRKSR